MDEDLKHKRILIVDDDRSVRESIRDLLGMAELDCSLASTGEEAKACLQSDQPALVVTDIQLPDISGYQICQDMKRDPASRHVPVLMMTGRFTESEDKIQGFDSGADEFLIKPFDPEYFLARVKSILRGAKAA